MTSTAERQLALLVPGLFGPTGEQGGTDRPFAALESLLARADRSTHLTAGFEAQLFGLFGVARPPDGDWPVAAVTRIVDAGVGDKERWTRADPVHLQASTNGLILTDAAEPKLTPQYSHALVSVPMVIVPADGWLFKAPHAHAGTFAPAHAGDIQTRLAGSSGATSSFAVRAGCQGLAHDTE